jgi:GTP-binding protein Era
MHKSGFVNILGRPNVGKSTLLNALMGEKMSIITSKPQTTRHRIIGLLSTDDYQMVFSDTPGIIYDPHYKMQTAMNSFAYSVLDDADVLLFVTDLYEKYDKDDPVFEKIEKVKAPKILIINKVDQIKEQQKIDLDEFWGSLDIFDDMMYLSAKEKINIDGLMSKLVHHLPEGPAYYPKDQLSDKPERFFISEIIREKILEQYKQEIPYSTEVIVTEFKEKESAKGPIIHIFAEIYVSRKTQKSIIIGRQGAAIKKLGTAARASIEEFLDSKVFLELYVKIKDNWRNDDKWLKQFGYKN